MSKIHVLKGVVYAVILLFLFSACDDDETSDSELKNKFVRSYEFNGSMSENVLRSYLSRSITMSGILFKSVYYDGNAPHQEDDERMVLNIGAKFIGRSIFMWGKDQNINNPLFLSEAKEKIDRIHAGDQELIFQAAIFEIVTPGVNKVLVPAYVFEAFDLPVVSRMLNYNDMLNEDGNLVGYWPVNNGSVPDITRLETKLWFFFLATKYIDIGIEAIHWAQMNLIGMRDKNNDYQAWFEVIGKVRQYAVDHARPGFILNDRHADRGIVVSRNLLLDFHSLPLRPP